MTTYMKNLIIICVTITIGSCAVPQENFSRLGSLTGKTFAGKKYYLGWGHADANDPAMMHNETKYDVLHTHEIFTHGLGGRYDGAKLVGQGNNEQILSSFEQIKSKMTRNDMYVQYSSGHGSEDGLQYGGSWSEIADRLLQLPAKEIIVFTMSCHSGGLVNEINRNQAKWRSFKEQGRTLFVMTSSTLEQTSSTGPAGAVSGPEGSEGSAFGHSLWKALWGDADGAYDGVKDGFIELGEIEVFVKNRTKQLGGHNPVSTGSYNSGLIMNRVPKSTDGLTYPTQVEGNESNSLVSLDPQF
jgi:hypothetical protein